MPVCVLNSGAFPRFQCSLCVWLWLGRASESSGGCDIQIFKKDTRGIQCLTTTKEQDTTNKNSTVCIKFQAKPICKKSPHRFLDGFAPWFHDSLVENMSPGLYTALKIRSITSDNEYRVVPLQKHVGILGPNNVTVISLIILLKNS